MCIWRDTEPLELPLLVTINEAVSVSPTRQARLRLLTRTPEEVKLVELLGVSDSISEVLSSRISGSEAL
ncbi:MAG: hypothetical protein Ct9H90mP26_1590 [Methanobacteriota archaeon]|nr:MAG: hypothetical protein Ct9H90mP26_1590 [Euryarchaeota archaeon]